MEIIFSYISGAKVEILDKNDPYSLNEYSVKFIDDETGVIIYETKIKSNHWVKTSRKWYTKWRTKVYNIDNELIKEDVLILKNKVVRINLESKLLEDTIAWFPYVDIFIKKHGCHLQCASYYNNLFEDEYTEINFLKPDQILDCDVSYDIKIFEGDKERNMNPIDPYKISTQRIITDILGLDYKEIRPRIYSSFREKKRYIDDKYVCISEHPSKYWNNGWQEIVDHLNSIGYKVVVISKEPTRLNNVIDETGDFPIEYRINNIYHCDFFIGVSSGLAWLSWAMNKQVVLISQKFNEFKCVKIYSSGQITPEMIIEKINFEIMNNKMIEVPVSNGEIVDKITILQIKMENIKDEEKLVNIKNEYDTLHPLMEREITDINDLYLELLEINKTLWVIEDKIRDKEKNKEFDNDFVELARSVYFTNDKRSEIKKMINKVTGSGFIEEKSYEEY